jgi:predicted nucleotidyltransferase
MRLTTEQAETIRQKAKARFGTSARVWLFGSRVDDNARGGDIDLLVHTATVPENAFRQSVALETDLQLALGDQKIDILLEHPGVEETPLHRIARNSGIEL